MVLTRWEPISEMRRMQADMNRQWRQWPRHFYLRPRSWREDGQLAVDVYQDKDNLVVRAAVPGVKPEDMDVSLVDGTLTIKGERKSEQEVKDADYIHREYQTGSFTRSVALPRGLNTGKAEASYDNGILTVAIPKSEESKHKSLKINVKAVDAKKA